MKKLLIYLTAIIAFSSCKKSEEELTFDATPEVRMSEATSNLRTALTASTNGWVVTLPTLAGGGYGFYMTFDAAQNVKMYGDLSAASINTPVTSTYRVKSVVGPELIFDTFNYISLLVDPVPSVFGGAAGSGYKSDIEFVYSKTNADTLFFMGKKYGQPMVMVKATAAQKASYEGNVDYKAATDKFKSFFAATKNPYIEMLDGTTTVRIGMSLDFANTLATGKRLSFTGILANGSIGTGTGKFGLTLSGAEMPGGFIYQGIKFINFKWKDATTLAIYDSKGTEYVIKSNPVPLIPLKTLMAYNGTYKGINIGTSLPLGVVSAFNTAYQASVTKFAAMSPSRTLISVRFLLVNGTTATVTTQNNNGTTTFAALATYTYKLEDGILTLSNPVYDGNWTARELQLIDIQNYFLSGPFRLDYVTSTNPANTSLMGGLYRVSDPTSFFYGTL